MFKTFGKTKNRKRIIAATTDHEAIFALEDGKITTVSPETLGTSETILSYIPPKFVVSTEFELSRSIPVTELEDEVTMRVFEELSLDQEIEYTIKYLEKQTAERDKSKFRAIEAFFIENHTLHDEFDPLVQKLHYIDHLLLPQHLFGNLYEREVLNRDGHDVFIHFTHNDAFIAVYGNGEYLYGKSFKSSLDTMYNKFCEIVGEKIERDLFDSLLTSDPFPAEHANYHEFFEILFGELLSNLSDTLTHARRLNNIQEFRHIYLSSAIGPIPSFADYSVNFSNIPIKNLEFDIPFEQHVAIDTLSYLLLLEGLKYEFQHPDDTIVNFSIFHRPPPLSQRDSGRFVMAAAAGFVIAFGLPLWQFCDTLFLQYRLSVKQSEYNDLHAIRVDHETRKNALQSTQQKLLTAIEGEKKLIGDRQNLLEHVDERQQHYLYKAKTLTELFLYFNRYGVKITKLDFADDQVVFSLYAKSDKPITTLIKGLVNSGRYKNVETAEIRRVGGADTLTAAASARPGGAKGNSSFYYISDVKVTIR